MTTPYYSASSPEMTAGINALESHVAAMRQSAQQVEDICHTISTVYQATSSSIFQQKMQDWLDAYNTVARSVQNLTDNSQVVSQVIGRAESDAHATALTLNVASSL